MDDVRRRGRKPPKDLLSSFKQSLPRCLGFACHRRPKTHAPGRGGNPFLSKLPRNFELKPNLTLQQSEAPNPLRTSCIACIAYMLCLCCLCCPCCLYCLYCLQRQKLILDVAMKVQPDGQIRCLGHQARRLLDELAPPRRLTRAEATGI